MEDSTLRVLRLIWARQIRSSEFLHSTGGRGFGYYQGFDNCYFSDFLESKGKYIGMNIIQGSLYLSIRFAVTMPQFAIFASVSSRSGMVTDSLVIEVSRNSVCLFSSNQNFCPEVYLLRLGHWKCLETLFVSFPAIRPWKHFTISKSVFLRMVLVRFLGTQIVLNVLLCICHQLANYEDVKV